MGQALADGCPAVGSFSSCVSGCAREQKLWSTANNGYFATYPSSQWVPATAEAWAFLRGTLTNMIPSTAIGDNGDTMALLEQATSRINTGTNAVPMGGMMDRLYWIVNGTAQVDMQQLALGTFTPKTNSWATTWVLEFIQGCIYQGWFSTETCGYGYQTVQRMRDSDSSESMPFTPAISFPGSQCFAGYNPTTNNGKGSIGRGSGTSGVYW